MTRQQYVTANPEETRALGRRIGQAARSGDVVLLQGDLGSGKTTLAQGIGEALGTGEVNSPTFILVAEHRGRIALHHADLYRLGPIDSIEDLGLDDVLGVEGLTVVEWPELCPGCWPDERLEVHITTDGELRRFDLIASGRRHETMLAEITEEGRL